MQNLQFLSDKKSAVELVISDLVSSGFLSPRFVSYINNLLTLQEGEDYSYLLLKFIDDEVLAKTIAKVMQREYGEPVDVDVSVRDIILCSSRQKRCWTFYFDWNLIDNLLKANRLGDYKVYQTSFSAFKKVYMELRRDKNPQQKLSQMVRGEDTGRLIFEYMIEQAYYSNASDIHIEFVERGGVIRFRIYGNLHVFGVLNNLQYYSLLNYIKTQIRKTGEPKDKRKDGSISIKVGGSDLDLRVNIMPAAPYIDRENTTYERCVIRLLRKSATLGYSLSRLGISKEEEDIIRTAVNSSYGMILTSGPTSSGKTTTLYAILNTIDAMERKIITVEDPVEYQNYHLWQQHQVSSNMSFHEILKGVLREDPDVCLVGEIRDEESARALVGLASTGHLTFSTIHANNSFEVIKRLMDLGVEKQDIYEYGVLFMAQRLLRTACPHCLVERKLNKAEALFLGLEGSVIVYDNTGCEKCGWTGTGGERVLVIELFPLFVDEIKEKLHRGEIYSYRQASKVVEELFGFKNMVKKALDLNMAKKVSISEVLAKVR